MSNEEFLKKCEGNKLTLETNGKEFVPYGDNQRFVLTNDGLSIQDTEKANATPERYCGFIRPISHFSTDETCGLDVEIKDRSGRLKTVAVDFGDIVDGGATVQRQLARAGLVFYKTQSRNTKPPINDFLNLYAIERREGLTEVEVVTKGGWAPEYDAFLFDNVTLGKGGYKVRLAPKKDAPKLTEIGTVKDWAATMGEYARRSSIMRFAAYVALAAPLVQIVGRQTTIFHLFGESSKGKSTALYVAASIYGSSADYVSSWRSTKSNQSTRAIKHNNLVLCLDELKQGAKALDSSPYDICNEIDKGRDNANGTGQEQRRWSLFILSTGEATLDGIRSRASVGVSDSATGEHVRFVEIPATDGDMGVFDVVDPSTSTDEGRRRLVDAIKQCPNCGAVGREFIEHVIREIADKGLDGFKKEAVEWMDGFISSCGTVGTHEARVLSAFAVAAYAGRLAQSWGLVPWDEGDAERVARSSFRAWLSSGESIEARNEELLSNVRSDPNRYHEYYDKIGYKKDPYSNAMLENFDQGKTHPSKGTLGSVLCRLNSDDSQTHCALIMTAAQFKDLAARVGGAYPEELSGLLAKRKMLVSNERSAARGARWRAQSARASRVGLRKGARYVVIKIEDDCDVLELLKKRCGA